MKCYTNQIAKELNVELRKFLQVNGISANVRKIESCGSVSIQVYTKAHGLGFAPADIRIFTQWMKDKGLTLVSAVEIDPAHLSKLTGKDLFEFEVRTTTLQKVI